jgi:hypothetical protein
MAKMVSVKSPKNGADPSTPKAFCEHAGCPEHERLRAARLMFDGVSREMM